MVGGFTIEESARRLGHYRWISMRLFELLGGWVADTAEVPAKLQFALNSRHHGWHAELLEERLPEVRELSPAAQTVAPSADVAAAVEQLSAIAGPDRTTLRLLGVYDVVVPHLITAMTWHLDRCTPVADLAVARTLRLILADLADDRAGAMSLVDSSVDGSDIRLALEQRFEASGGISGPEMSVERHDVARPSSSGADDVDVPG